jgi:2-polyprenyl-3-methyl-5-hydroxy-6-metoxy-1,4-benzoquinol methylase
MRLMSMHESIPGSKSKFAFGKNWKDFVDHNFSEVTLEASKKKLLSFLELPNLNGLSFVDFGSGSGLHSLAALEVGAEKVLSIDFDNDSVSCALQLRDQSKYEGKWEVKQGSLLDKNFLETLPKFDIVYCWGVAHHTGDMWTALQNMNQTVKPGGRIFLAIYNHVEGKLGSKMWHKIKKLYNTSPAFIKTIMECLYILFNFTMLILKFNNPFSVIKKYKEKRGMSWKTDLVDWLGGYPYEYASVKEIFDFYKARGFELQNIKTTNYIGCNQFLFIKNKI